MNLRRNQTSHEQPNAVPGGFSVQRSMFISHHAPRPNSALSLIEMMVTVALLAIIILGLVAMFDQTRKAFTGGMGAVDFQDAGRVALDMIAHDLEQMAPDKNPAVFPPDGNPLLGYTNHVNFYTDVDPGLALKFTRWPTPVGDVITNSMNRLYFVTRFNQGWSAVGYRIDPQNVGNGLGTLYQYRNEAPLTNYGVIHPGIMFNDFLNNTNTPPLYRVIDNVVDFRVRAYDPNGVLMPVMNIGNVVVTNSPATGDSGYLFTSNAVPAYVELELSILETRTADRYRSMAGINAQTFLTNHTGQVHVFRRRVTIPGVDRTAYP